MLIYKLVPFHSDYRVGNDGTVWSRRWGKPWYRLKPSFAGEYHSVVIACKRYYIHRLVLETFVGPCPEGLVCRHLDGDKFNNRADNLAWGTLRENINDKVRHGTIPKGECHWHTTLTADEVRSIRNEYAAGGIFQRELAVKYLTTRGVIGDIVRRVSWKHID